MVHTTNVSDTPGMLDTTPDDTNGFRINRARLGLLVCCTGAFVALLAQSPSTAEAESFDPLAQGSAGSLVSKDYEIHIMHVGDSQRFTVTDRTGTVLASNLTAEQMRLQFGDIPLPTYAEHADAPDATLMLVDDGSAF